MGFYSVHFDSEAKISMIIVEVIYYLINHLGPSENIHRKFYIL